MPWPNHINILQQQACLRKRSAKSQQALQACNPILLTPFFPSHASGHTICPGTPGRAILSSSMPSHIEQPPGFSSIHACERGPQRASKGAMPLFGCACIFLLALTTSANEQMSYLQGPNLSKNLCLQAVIPNFPGCSLWDHMLYSPLPVSNESQHLQSVKLPSQSCKARRCWL